MTSYSGTVAEKDNIMSGVSNDKSSKQGVPQTREARATAQEKRAGHPKQQRATADGYGQTREARYQDHLNRNQQKHEGDREVVKSGEANPKPKYLLEQ